MSVLRFGLTLWLVLAACGSRGAAPSTGAVDDSGDTVALDRTARRIVSLSPSTTELLFAIGARDELVGRTRWCDYPPEAAAVPSVGDGLNPNVELVVARRPDLVVFYSSPANNDAIARLRSFGIATASLSIDRLDDVARATRLLGRLSGHADRADSLATAFTARLDSARGHAAAGARKVAVIVWDNPPIVIGAGSFLTDLLRLAGARNVFDDIPRPSAPASVETIAARDPDLLLVLGGDSTPAFAERPEWRTVRAARERHIVSMDGSEFERPSFRSFDAVRRLRAALHERGGS